MLNKIQQDNKDEKNIEIMILQVARFKGNVERNKKIPKKVDIKVIINSHNGFHSFRFKAHIFFYLLLGILSKSIQLNSDLY